MNDLRPEDRLEPVDVEMRSPSVVLSVRLDDLTARRLHGIARARGVRISDLLREAAVTLAASANREAGPHYLVKYAQSRIALGTASVDSQSRWGSVTIPVSGATSPWDTGVSSEVLGARR